MTGHIQCTPVPCFLRLFNRIRNLYFDNSNTGPLIWRICQRFLNIPCTVQLFQLKPQLSHVKSMLDSAVYSHLNCLRFCHFIWKAYITFSTNMCVLLTLRFDQGKVIQNFDTSSLNLKEFYIFLFYLYVWLKIGNLHKWKVSEIDAHWPNIIYTLWDEWKSCMFIVICSLICNKYIVPLNIYSIQ